MKMALLLHRGTITGHPARTSICKYAMLHDVSLLFECSLIGYHSSRVIAGSINGDINIHSCSTRGGGQSSRNGD